MTLSDVLHTLSSFGKEVGLSQTDLYSYLFDVSDENLEQTVKNVFSSRPLTRIIFKDILEDDGFIKLCLRIRSKLLTIIGKHVSIYDSLCSLLDQDEALTLRDKQLLIASCDPNNEDEVAQFIAVCILCGNYNTQQQKNRSLNEDKPSPLPAEYGINIRHYVRNSPSILFEYVLWSASQREFFASRSEGQRFSSFTVIEQLLPKGYIAEPNFQMRGMCQDGTSAKIMDICRTSTRHIAVIGEGGIGKTTFLHQFMAEEYSQPAADGLVPSKYMSGRPVTFFIELNRCPDNIAEWYEDSLKKTNFITRYIGQMVENHQSLYDISPELLHNIEQELQKIPPDGRPHYRLLLDGFNEVSTGDGYAIRTCLSNEISALSQYRNVQVITTSRITQAAYYTSKFLNVPLIGLEDSDISSYLISCGKSEAQAGIIMANKPLLKLLRIPLYLCMFCAENFDTQEPLPETSGEILYFFFHRNSHFYNIRKRSEDTRTNPLDPLQTAFVLDFILPYIAWHYEKDDRFYISKTEFTKLITQAVQDTRILCSSLTVLPFADFQYQPEILAQTIQRFYNGKEILLTPVLDCISSYLSIVYGYTESSGPYGERNRISFIHHHFRDYFSAIWDIQLLRLLQCMNVPQFFLPAGGTDATISCHAYLNTGYWNSHKSLLISEILMEHRNAPILDPITGDWFLPPHRTDEQGILSASLDYCRFLLSDQQDIHYLLSNVLSSILAGRKELTGVDLSELDLKSCCFFNVTCSRKGKHNTLAAIFHGSHIYKHNFEPENHLDSVIDTIYVKDHCFTLDGRGCLKCWDAFSGKLEYTLYAGDPTGSCDLTSSGFLKLSPDKRWLATKVQKYSASSDNYDIRLSIFDLDSPERNMETFYIYRAKKALNFFSFTGDSKGILAVYDYSHIMGISLLPLSLSFDLKSSILMRTSQVYSADLHSPIYVYTSDYESYGWDAYEPSDGIEDGKDSQPSISCFFYRLSPAAEEHLFSFSGMPGTVPTVNYMPSINSFLYFNYDTMEIEQYDCEQHVSHALYPGLALKHEQPPSCIHPHPDDPWKCYIMYPKNCYLVELNPRYGSGILMKYDISGVRRLLSGSPQDTEKAELCFDVSVAPSRNRFLVCDDSTTYEWHTIEDTLYPRYNMQFYSCTGLIHDAKHDRFILVHQYNGISVFSGDPVRLINSLCFYERDYYIGCCCYDDATQLLALSFVRSDHEKIILVNMADSKQKTIFSTSHQRESIENLCFHQEHDRLLIGTQYQSSEYLLTTDSLQTVKTAGHNERLAGCHYNGKEIVIVVTQHEKIREPMAPPRCEHYKRKGSNQVISYSLEWYYILPELTDELHPYFIYTHGDLGIQGTFNTDLIQDFWITKGFFLNPSENDAFSLPKLKCYSAKGRPLPDRPIVPLQMTYFRHTMPLETLSHENDHYVSYADLDEQTKEAIFLFDSCYLFHTKDYSACTYKEIRSGLAKDLDGDGGLAFWDYAIPWHNGEMIVCFESYHLAVVKIETGVEKQTIDYTPGLAIQGVDFRYVHTSDDVIPYLKHNGGIL